MLSKQTADLMMEQINKEFFSAYLYLDMANYYADAGLDGFENWFLVQAQEERDHALLFRSYLLNNDHPVSLHAIDAPSRTYTDHSGPLRYTLEHEKIVSASINEIYSSAMAEKDFRTMQFLDWFVKEQGEEEKSASDLIRKFELFGNDSKSLYLLDQELAARVYTAPTLTL